jgi:hypothetical protein
VTGVRRYEHNQHGELDGRQNPLVLEGDSPRQGELKPDGGEDTERDGPPRLARGDTPPRRDDDVSFYGMFEMAHRAQARFGDVADFSSDTFDTRPPPSTPGLPGIIAVSIWCHVSTVDPHKSQAQSG